MADINYTKSQQQVIDTRKTNLLVSASAGSGKTRVLVDRVIKRVTEEGVGIDQLLIVTFTKAAAKEMKERIRKSLEKEINHAEGEKRQRLMTQLSLLPVANISTLDAFCQQLIEHYYYIINLDPVFRLLADRTEGILLRDQVWQDVREDLYGSDEDGLFRQLTVNFSNDRNDDGLTELVNKVYFYANSKPNPTEWLAQLAQPYDIGGSLNDSDIYQKKILPLVSDRLTEAIKGFKHVIALGIEMAYPKIVERSQADIERLESVKTQLPFLKWNELIETLFVARKAAPQVSTKDEMHDQKKVVQESWKLTWQPIDDLKATYFALNESRTTEVMQQSHQIVSTLAKTVQAFSEAYQTEKLRQHMLDFSDLEHFALEILQSETDQGRAVRKQLRNQYTEIMVDEYQDTNELQESILQTITKHDPGNLFMVGDVKQSIYRFRLADPSLFLNKFKRFKEHDEEGTNIELAENFRSVKNVDDFTNLIFTQLMDPQLGEMTYTGASKLVYGATYYPADYQPGTELLIYESQKQEKHQDEESTDEEPVDDAFQIDGKAEGQITMVGQRIQELIANKTPIFDRETGKLRPVEYRDIALLTPTKGNNLVITELFSRLNIPVLVNDAQNYFKTTEVQIMMALLSIIDNPYQDIPLVAILRSPIVGLDENQLAYLRITDKTGDYFQAVLRFHDTYQSDNSYGDVIYPKIKRFLEQLQLFKNVAKQNQLVTLIWRIYQETGFLDYVAAMPAGKQRQANLHALYERAAVYEQSNFKGLFQFVQFIQRMQNEDEDLSEAPTQVSDNVVRVMTIHGSKGLEFPVVFLMDMSHKFNMQDTMGDAVLNDKLGIGITYFDEKHRAKFDSLQKMVASDATRQASLAEEMRKLYVALTRAEQQLFIVGAVDDHEKTITSWENAQQSNQLVLDMNQRLAAKNNLTWIGMCLIRHPKFDQALRVAEGNPLFTDLNGDETKFSIRFVTPADLQQIGSKTAPLTGEEWLKQLESQSKEADLTDVNVDEIDQIMNFSYPDQVATRTTAYQSVSEVKRLFNDPDSMEMGQFSKDWDKAGSANRYVSKEFGRPKFLQTERKPVPTEIGTATHLLLQEIDLTQPITSARIAELIQQLVRGGVISESVASQINQQSILNFFENSQLGKLLLENPDEVKREQPFSLLLSANKLFNEIVDGDAKVLIHGIMDGYVTLDDEVILFDYKTDYVSMKDHEASLLKIEDRYRGQVNLYGEALRDILRRPVTHKYLYLLSSGDLVEIRDD